MTDSNPPVGATVVDGRGYAWRFAEDALWHWIVGNGVQITVGVQPSDHESALTALWRMQQRAEQAEAERDAQMRRAEEAEAAWTEEKQRNMKAEAGLAKLRALAVEAEMILRGVGRPQGDSLGARVHDAANVLAALATPNQETTP